MRDGAHELLYGPPERLTKIMLEQMLDMIRRGFRPTWENYTNHTDHWPVVRKYLNKEQQFIYRCRWMLIVKNHITYPNEK